jgi:hypothetical protein
MEIVQTEEVYVKGLHALITIYLRNLKQLPQEVMPPSAIKTVFGDAYERAFHICFTFQFYFYLDGFSPI